MSIAGEARPAILSFLGLDEPDDDRFGQNVRILFAVSDFSKEVTTTVMWLNRHGLDIRCIRLQPYNLDGRLLIDVQQLIPLPEAVDYQVQLKEKEQRETVLMTSVTKRGCATNRGGT